MEKMTVSFPAENLGACGSHAVFARNAPSFRVGEGVPFLRRVLVASVILSRFPVPHNLALPGVIPPPTVASSRALRSSEVPPVRLPAHLCDPLGPAPSSPSPTAGGRRRRRGTWSSPRSFACCAPHSRGTSSVPGLGDTRKRPSGSSQSGRAMVGGPRTP